MKDWTDGYLCVRVQLIGPTGYLCVWGGAQVEAPILIPRPETEELVEWVLNAMPKEKKSLRFLDVGCGTGAIGLALLKVIDYTTAGCGVRHNTV